MDLAWDASLFRGLLAGEQYFVYVTVDFYSRLIVGYGVFYADNTIAFFSEALEKNGI